MVALLARQIDRRRPDRAVAAAGVMVLVLNRLNLPQGLHAPFVATGALVIFACARLGARLRLPRRLYRRPRGRQPARRAPTTRSIAVPRRRDLARRRSCMFVLLGLLAWPEPAAATASAGAARGARADVHRAARPRCSSACGRSGSACARSCSSPGSACAARSASSSPRSRCWSGCRKAQIYFDVGLRRGADLAAGAGLDHRAGSALAARRAAARRRVRAPHRARSARPA